MRTQRMLPPLVMLFHICPSFIRFIAFHLCCAHEFASELNERSVPYFKSRVMFASLSRFDSNKGRNKNKTQNAMHDDPYD